MQNKAARRAHTESWMITFADLLGIVLAIFVLIYATSDRQSQKLREIMFELSAALYVEPSSSFGTIVTDVMSPIGYQKALLEKQLGAMPYWSLDEDSNANITLSLRGQSLLNALSDGVWLDIIERFERTVTLQVFTQVGAPLPPIYSGAAAVVDLRAERGLTAPWAIVVGPAAKNRQLTALVTIHNPDTIDALRFSDTQDTVEPALTAGEGR